MARYLGPTSRLSRREGSDLGFKSGLKPIENKCKFTKLPGRFGESRAKASEYCLQLREKQKLKRTYGLLEKQFKLYFKKATKMKGSTGENLLKLLEQRLDNIVYRVGFACTRAEARQFISHKAIIVNDQKVTIPSYLVSEGDVIAVREKSSGQARISFAIELVKAKGIPDWLDVDLNKLSAKLLRVPSREDMSPDVNENLIVELYSK